MAHIIAGSAMVCKRDTHRSQKHHHFLRAASDAWPHCAVAKKGAQQMPAQKIARCVVSQRVDPLAVQDTPMNSDGATLRAAAGQVVDSDTRDLHISFILIAYFS